jgi:FKBP-type peptidyl-prolyl cis-trans isomerase FklB
MDEGMKGEATDNPELSELGTNIGNALKEQKTAGLMGDSSLTVDIKLIKQGLINGMKGSNIQMTAEEAQLYLNTTMQKLQEKRMQEQNGPNKAAGEVFLKENAKKAGVVTTASGLQYEVIKKGTGALPNDTSRVKVHYHGTLIDGTVFDSSVDRGEPAVFGVNQVIKGLHTGSHNNIAYKGGKGSRAMRFRTETYGHAHGKDNGKVIKNRAARLRHKRDI